MVHWLHAPRRISTCVLLNRELALLSRKAHVTTAQSAPKLFSSTTSVSWRRALASTRIVNMQFGISMTWRSLWLLRTLIPQAVSCSRSSTSKQRHSTCAERVKDAFAITRLSMRHRTFIILTHSSRASHKRRSVGCQNADWMLLLAKYSASISSMLPAMS